MAAAMRSFSACEIIAAPYQLPDAPPPPNDPPPPPKPPPPEKPPPENPPPENPPEEPVHQVLDDHGLADLRRRPFGWLGIAPTIMAKTTANMASAKIRIRI